MNWNSAICALQCISCYSDWFGKFVPSTIRNQSCTKPTQTNHKLVLCLCTDYTTNNVYLLNFSGILIALLHYLHFFRSTNLTMIKITFDLITLKWKSILLNSPFWLLKNSHYTLVTCIVCNVTVNVCTKLFWQAW